MTEDRQPAPPSAAEIERLFRAPAVVLSRPVILGGLNLLKVALRFTWQAEGVEHLANLEPPIIFAANHVSHADTPAILSMLPRSIRGRTAVAAALDVFGATNGTRRSLRRRLLPWVVASGFHAFAFDRHGPPLRSIRTAVQLIRGGWSVLLYPEGTRSRGGAMGPFKAGVGVLARSTGRPVVPIHVSGGNGILPCGRFLPRSGRVLVRFGSPMSRTGSESTSEFATRLREQVRELGEGGRLSGASAVEPPIKPLPEPNL